MGYYDSFKAIPNILTNKYKLRRDENKENIFNITNSLGQLGDSIYDYWKDRDDVKKAVDYGTKFFNNKDDAEAFVSGLTGREAMEAMRQKAAEKAARDQYIEDRDEERRYNELITNRERRYKQEDRAYQEGLNKKNYLQNLLTTLQNNRNNLRVSIGQGMPSQSQKNALAKYDKTINALNEVLELGLPEESIIDNSDVDNGNSVLSIEEYADKIKGLRGNTEGMEEFFRKMFETGELEDILNNQNYSKIRGAIKDMLFEHSSNKSYKLTPSIKRAMDTFGVKTNQKIVGEGKAEEWEKAYKSFEEKANNYYEGGGDAPVPTKKQLQRYIDKYGQGKANIIWTAKKVSEILGG